MTKTNKTTCIYATVALVIIGFLQMLVPEGYEVMALGISVPVATILGVVVRALSKRSEAEASNL